MRQEKSDTVKKGDDMTNDQFLQAVWEAVAQLMRRTGNEAGEALIRGWRDRGGPPELVVAQARAEFEASVLATFQAYMDGIAQPIRPAGAPVSEPVLDAVPMTPPVEVRAAELLKWLRDGFRWPDLESDDSYTALRASSQLRNTVDALRFYGATEEAHALLRAKGIDPRAVS